MSIAFQIALILVVVFIAYWWANQGLFSSLLHFVCVVCAGAIAFALWEPITVNLLLRDTWFDNYAWGAALVGLFGFSLLILRVIFDKTVRANVDLPNSANMVFGGLFGIGSGVITAGILFIGIGYTQSADEVMGFKGTMRDGPQISAVDQFWLDAPAYTVAFYEFLSANAMHPDIIGEPLADVNPDINTQAFALMRDTYDNGRARVTLPPESVTITGYWLAPDRAIVGIEVAKSAFDHNSQFTLSKSQVRLIGKRGSKTTVGHPDRWSQSVQLSGRREDGDTNFQPVRTFLFDDASHYATSIPGAPSANLYIEFPFRSEYPFFENGGTPRHIQIKGVRFELPAAQAIEAAAVAALRANNFNLTFEPLPVDENAPFVQGTDIHVTSTVQPLATTINSLRGLTVNEENNTLVRGHQVFQSSSGRGISRETRINGFHTTMGALIVRVDVSRGSSCSIYGRPRDVAGEDASPYLIDDRGRRYLPKGYMVERPDEIEVYLSPGQPITSLREIPPQPTSRTHTVWLIYEITQNVHLTSFRLDDVTVARCDLIVR